MSRATKDKEKMLQDKLQIILSNLLRDEDNKYCVDCDAKGPRWASWNLGIFLCIRCAGIHRNLGVHISKVKSVNLDTWTPEQVATIKEMGNSRARAVFEANVPEGFRRPQSDSALEAFIRTKYEQRKYVAREWVPDLHPNVAALGLDDLLVDSSSSSKSRASSLVASPSSTTTAAASASAKSTSSDKSKSTTSTATASKSNGAVSSSARASPAAAASTVAAAAAVAAAPKPKAVSSDVDLLSLDTPSSTATIVSPVNAAAAAAGAATTAPSAAVAPAQDLFNGFLCDNPQQPSSSSSLFPDGGTSTASSSSSSSSAVNTTPKPVTKDSIMALYGNSSSTIGGAGGGHFTPPMGQFGPSGAMGASPINARGGAAAPLYGGGYPGGVGVGVGSMTAPGMMGSAAPGPYNMQAAMAAQHQQSQQLHLQQVQQQLASLKMNGSAGAAAAGASSSNGATLSNNLWQ